MLSISYSWDLLCIRPPTYLSQGSDSTWQNASADPQLLPNLAEHLQLLDSWKSHRGSSLAVQPPPLEQIHQSLITLGTQAQVKPGRRALHGLCPGLQIHHLGLNDPSRKHHCPCSISLDVSKDHQKTDRSIAALTPQTEQTCLHI